MKVKFVKKQEIITKMIMSAVLLALFFLSFIFSDNIEEVLGLKNNLKANQVYSTDLVNAGYKVHYIDVGQGNSTLIELPDKKTLLIDGGNAMYGEKVASVLTDCGIESIDYMIASHSDADHIGGLNYILEMFEVKHIYRPFQISGTGKNADSFEVYEFEDLKGVYQYYLQTEGVSNKISRVTSLTYKNFIKNIYSEQFFDDGKLKYCEIDVFYDGLTISGENYTIEFFAPLKRDNAINISEYSDKTGGYTTKGYGVSDSNNNSSVVLVTCFDDKFLFTGDASFEQPKDEGDFGSGEEFDFVSSLTKTERTSLSNITVYLAGHHGSSTSSSDQLLSLINPKFIVISVAEDNDFGHPSTEALFRIKQLKSLETDGLLSTDIAGDICFSSLHGEVVYSLENSDNILKHTISAELLTGVICLTLTLIVVFYKPYHQRNSNLLTP